MLDFLALATQCSPNVAPQTMAAVVSVESSHNPYAIGVVNGRLVRQPATLQEAVATAKELERQGKNFSVGIAQVNRYNLPKYRMTYEQAFDACQNMRVGGLILGECYGRALASGMPPQPALRAAFSCYYSGNFTRGFRPDPGHQLSYVQKVVLAASGQQQTVQVPAVAVDVTDWTAGAAQASAPARPRRNDGGGVMVLRDASVVADEADQAEAALPPATPETEQASTVMPAEPPIPVNTPTPASRPSSERTSALVF